MKKNKFICKAKNVSLVFLIFASSVVSAMESNVPEEGDSHPKMLTVQIRAKVEQILQNFKKNMDAYYERTGNPKRIAVTPTGADKGKFGQHTETPSRTTSASTPEKIEKKLSAPAIDAHAVPDGKPVEPEKKEPESWEGMTLEGRRKQEEEQRQGKRKKREEKRQAALRRIEAEAEAEKKKIQEEREQLIRSYQAAEQKKQKEFEAERRNWQESIKKEQEERLKKQEEEFIKDYQYSEGDFGSYSRLTDYEKLWIKRHYLNVLGLTESPTWEMVKKAYYKLAQKWHPDKTGGDAEKFKPINEAYGLLEKIYNSSNSSNPLADTPGAHLNPDDRSVKLGVLGLKEGATWAEVDAAFETISKGLDKEKARYKSLVRAYNALKGNDSNG